MDEEKLKGASDKRNNESVEDDALLLAGNGHPMEHTTNHNKIYVDEGPKAKIPKLYEKENEEEQLDLSLNLAYITKEFTDTLEKHWSEPHQVEDFKDDATGAEVYVDPFQICLLPSLLRNTESCHKLVREIVNKVKFTRKQMDLYEFYQSTDLSNMVECKLITSFLKMLRQNVRPLLEKVTNLKLDYVSASCSMYTCGDYLLVHDDLLKDRQIAFIYYLSPWKDAEEWSKEQGGCLEIFKSDEHCFPHFPVRRNISPRNNQFAFFKVGSRSFHQVGEVTTFDYPRLTINGWFHGASNDDLTAEMRPFTKPDFKPPQNMEHIFELFLNEIYLKSITRKGIQRRIEENSEICLYEFFRQEIFDQALDQLCNDDTLKWQRQGPANAQNYEILDLSTASGTVEQLTALFSSTQMFELLRDYTDLDLAGPSAIGPTYSLELQRWSHGNYTVLGDGAVCDENCLDLIYYLNASEGAAVITYLSPEMEPPVRRSRSSNSDTDEEDDSVLLTITPVDNSLNMVFRCEGTTKFTKYVSRNTPLDKGPVYVVSCSYKE